MYGDKMSCSTKCVKFNYRRKGDYVFTCVCLSARLLTGLLSKKLSYRRQTARRV